MIQVQTLFDDGDQHVSGDGSPYLRLAGFRINVDHLPNQFWKSVVRVVSHQLNMLIAYQAGVDGDTFGETKDCGERVTRPMEAKPARRKSGNSLNQLHLRNRT